MKAYLVSLELKLKKKKKKLLFDKATIEDLKQKLDEAAAQAKTTKEETIQLLEVKSLRAVEGYKNLAPFRKEVIKTSSYCYEYDFDDYKAKVKRALPNS